MARSTEFIDQLWADAGIARHYAKRAGEAGLMADQKLWEERARKLWNEAAAESDRVNGYAERRAS